MRKEEKEIQVKVRRMELGFGTELSEHLRKLKSYPPVESTVEAAVGKPKEFKAEDFD